MGNMVASRQLSKKDLQFLELETRLVKGKRMLLVSMKRNKQKNKITKHLSPGTTAAPYGRSTASLFATVRAAS